MKGGNKYELNQQHTFVCRKWGGGHLLPTLYLKSNLSINNNIDKDYEITSSNTSLL